MAKPIIIRPNHRISPYGNGMQLQTFLQSIREAMDVVSAEDRHETRNQTVLLVDAESYNEKYIIRGIKVEDNRLTLLIALEF